MQWVRIRAISPTVLNRVQVSGLAILSPKKARTSSITSARTVRFPAMTFACLSVVSCSTVNSTAGINAICRESLPFTTELSTMSRSSGMRFVRRIYLRIVSPLLSATESLLFFPSNLCNLVAQVRSVRFPCLAIASRRILYAKASSEGNCCVL